MQWQLIKKKVKYRNFLVLEIAFFALIFIVNVFVFRRTIYLLRL